MRIYEYISYGSNRENKKDLCYESQMKILFVVQDCAVSDTNKEVNR